MIEVLIEPFFVWQGRGCPAQGSLAACWAAHLQHGGCPILLSFGTFRKKSAESLRRAFRGRGFDGKDRLAQNLASVLVMVSEFYSRGTISNSEALPPGKHTVGLRAMVANLYLDAARFGVCVSYRCSSSFCSHFALFLPAFGPDLQIFS